MKSTKNKESKSRKGLLKIMTLLALAGIGTAGVMAQNSMPAPGTGGGFNPAPIGGGAGPGGPGPGFGGPGPGFGPGPGGPGPGPAWGGSGPGLSIGINIGSGLANQGTVNVIACGFDNTGIYRTIPMTVSYTYSYGQYDVTVLSAMNPYTNVWMPDIDMPAYNTSYFLRGQTYNFYAPLSTGTYYFNL